MRAPILASILTLTASCSSGVFGVGDDRDPLVTIRGRYDGPLPEEGTLRAGIIWAGVPVFVPYCHKYGPNPREEREVPTVAQKGCRDPFEVVPGAVGPSVPFDRAGDRTFEIPIEHLPDAGVMVGTLAGRVAYGTVVLFDDIDDDGFLDLGARCRRRDADDPLPEPHDRLIVSTFTRLDEPQTRIAYVEGDFDADSFFYPHPNCTALPPRGFSLWNVGDLFDPNGTCEVTPLERELVLEQMPATSLAHLSCRPSENESFSRPPPDEGTGQSVMYDCTPEGELVAIDPQCPCPGLRVYSLRGCYDDAACTEPDWDLDPPMGWPCPGPVGQGN
jgi:hypothetical protein